VLINGVDVADVGYIGGVLLEGFKEVHCFINQVQA
jgi:hypothetical protein